MSFNIYMPTRVIWGRNCVADNADVFSSLGNRCLILTGGSSAQKSGALDDVTNTLKKSGISYTVFNKISANPLVSVCHEAGAAARDCGAEFIIGIGGGSVLDAAKAVAIYAVDETLSPIDIYKRTYNGNPLKVALVGTTAGTGSEVTAVSVLTNDETGFKKSISGSDCYAAVSFCDPEYTYSMPCDTTISTAFDALAHATEGFFTPKMCMPLEPFARTAISDLVEFFRRLGAGEEITSSLRDKVYYASLCAGLVINTCGTAFPHPLGYILTENYGIPHGMACAAFYPALIKRASEFAEAEKLDLFASFVNRSVDDVIKVLVPFIDIKNVKITREEAELYAARWDSGVPKNFTASPGGLTKEEAVNLLCSI